MKKSSILFFILLMILLLNACQRNIANVRRFPQKFYEVVPHGNENIDLNKNITAAEKNKIKIRVKYADFEFLYNNFSYVAEKNEFGYTTIYRLVPFFTAKRAYGFPDIENYFSQFTVFYIYFENDSTEPVLFDPNKCVIVDDMGNQYSSLDINFFKENKFLFGFMEEAPFSGIKRTIKPLSSIMGEVGEIASAAASITPISIYNIKGPSKDYYDESKRYDYKFSMDEKLFLQGGEVFPTVNYSGFLVFRDLNENAMNFKVIFPHIAYGYSEENIKKNISFEFNFKKVPSLKNPYLDSSLNKIIYKPDNSSKK